MFICCWSSFHEWTNHILKCLWSNLWWSAASSSLQQRLIQTWRNVAWLLVIDEGSWLNYPEKTIWVFRANYWLCWTLLLMIIERSPDWPKSYADNMYLHVSSKGITSAGSVHRSRTVMGVYVKRCVVSCSYICKGVVWFEASTLCRYAVRKGDLFVLSSAWNIFFAVGAFDKAPTANYWSHKSSECMYLFNTRKTLCVFNTRLYLLIIY